MFNTYLYNEILYNVALQSAPIHYLIDGSYTTQPTPTNRVLVIGKDTSDNPVTGADEDTAQIALVGERLDMKFLPSIHTATLAAQVADAALERARLSGKEGFITLPPNCGVELWDVITIYDSMAAQEGISFRVLGVRLVYDSTDKGFIQQLQLGDV